ncbi:hypothetical protein BOTBODRAFT_35049 [Botryobasidium botryosum FD-172 SS1]|uniref:Protein kinase domain-containing protein n=1 Tax=Botryobasidium botryosum (strain FD-172 SS1) TaxID=930990 RepID=A0A067M7Q5_BOTB1|nr:hypothetical protein BOTBODRAFT_35049 [Botryobasidium botryosum FD-172 SS1]
MSGIFTWSPRRKVVPLPADGADSAKSTPSASTSPTATPAPATTPTPKNSANGNKNGSSSANGKSNGNGKGKGRAPTPHTLDTALSVVTSPPPAPSPPPVPQPDDLPFAQHPGENWWPQRCSRPWYDLNVDLASEPGVGVDSPVDHRQAQVQTQMHAQSPSQFYSPLQPQTHSMLEAQSKFDPAAVAAAAAEYEKMMMYANRPSSFSVTSLPTPRPAAVSALGLGLGLGLGIPSPSPSSTPPPAPTAAPSTISATPTVTAARPALATVTSSRLHLPRWRPRSIPEEQAAAYIRTALAVSKATGKEVLKGAATVIHDALSVGVDVIGLAPIPGLEPAVRMLLSIWDVVDLVETNRMACLHLTERCANILISIIQEIHEVGDDNLVAALQEPVSKLVASFEMIHRMMKKQAERPFIKRYLKRDEVLQQIRECNESLSDSMSVFNLSIQFRLLSIAQAQAGGINGGGFGGSSIGLGTGVGGASYGQEGGVGAGVGLIKPRPSTRAPIPTPFSPPSTSTSTSPSTSPSKSPPPFPTRPSEAEAEAELIKARLDALRREQEALTTQLDTTDMRAMLRAALTSDAKLIDTLQVERHELPEAIKTFQRALEALEWERDRHAGAGGGESGVGLGLETGLGAGAGVGGEREGAGRRERGAGWGDEDDELLHHEFLEEGVGAMRRLSGERQEAVPIWTITRWEIDREQMIGVGYFSEVYKGTWKNKTVAIKVLAPLTPAALFRHEVEIWKSLKHPNVLELLGASSTTGNPPFFAVSPYLKNGNLVVYLAHLMRRSESPHYVRYIREIAVGMEYLHDKGVLHGDLKASNVLINDDLHCVISDFGQSEMKNEVFRLSGKANPRGTLRWLAPEVMQGEGLTMEVDVYAFAICCVEILTGGELPWPMLDDIMVRHLVVDRNERPRIPWRASSLSLVALITACWERDPALRPPFSLVAKDTAQLLGGISMLHELPGLQSKASPKEEHKVPSPSLKPTEFLGDSIQARVQVTPAVYTASIRTVSSTADGDTPSSYKSLEEVMPSNIPPQEFISPEIPPAEGTYIDDHEFHPLSPVASERTVSSSDPSQMSSPRFAFTMSRKATGQSIDWERVTERFNERIYRLRLQHEHHPSLKLPLWQPSEVKLGAVGYLQKPHGRFVTLFNAFEPGASSDGRLDLPSIHGYGLCEVDSFQQNKRNAAQRGLDWAAARASSLIFHSHSDGVFRRNVLRRYAFPLRHGRKSAHIVVETSIYHYMRTSDAAKHWFTAAIETILKTYGPEHGIHKEDVVLIIGKLDAPAYGLFVNHAHPDSELHFNVFSERREGEDWGAWSIDEVPVTSSSSIHPDPVYEEPPSPHGLKLSANKVSKWSENERMDSVLLARLHFKTDASEPTSL